MSAPLPDTVSSLVHEPRYALRYAAVFCVKHTGKLVQEDFRRQTARNDVLDQSSWYDAVSSSSNTEDKDAELMLRHLCCVKIFMTVSYCLPVYGLVHALFPLLYFCVYARNYGDPSSYKAWPISSENDSVKVAFSACRYKDSIPFKTGSFWDCT